MVDTQYEDLLRKIRDTGNDRPDRTGTGTRSVFHTTLEYNMADGFPLITTKRVPFRLIAEELLWFLMGDSNIRYLVERDIHIWSDWPFKKYLQATGQPVPEPNTPAWEAQISAYEKRVVDDAEFAAKYGDLGPVYGVQWVKWAKREGGTINQIQNAVDLIKKDPYSRRILVSAWNPEDLGKMALDPCHRSFQLYVEGDGTLSIQVDQRSCDTVLGVPFNIASYSLLLEMFALVCGLKPGRMIWIGADTHIYKNHFEQVELQLSRDVRPFPRLKINRVPDSIFDFKIEDFEIVGYNPHPRIDAPIAV